MVLARSNSSIEVLIARAPENSSGSFADSRNKGSVSKVQEMITPLQRYVPLDPSSLFDQAFHADGLFGSRGEDNWGVF